MVDISEELKKRLFEVKEVELGLIYSAMGITLYLIVMYKKSFHEKDYDLKSVQKPTINHLFLLFASGSTATLVQQSKGRDDHISA